MATNRSNENTLRCFAGIFALTPRHFADAYRVCRQQYVFGERDVPEEQTRPEYWVPRLAKGWLSEPGFWPTRNGEGYGIAGEPNPEWVGMTEQEMEEAILRVQIYARRLLHLAKEETEYLLAPRFSTTVGELQESWLPVYRLVGGDHSGRTIREAFRAIRYQTYTVEPEYAARRRSGEISLIGERSAA